MIHSRKELRFYLQADRMINRGYFKNPVSNRLKELFFPDYIMNYLICLRKVEYFSHQKGFINKFKSLYYGYKQRKYGIKLGYSIAKDVFGYGLVIPHYGTIVVGSGNHIGNYAVLHTSICITNGRKSIGDGLYVSTGAKLTTVQELGNNITIASNSVLTKSCNKSNVLIAGIPASVKSYRDPWYEQEERFKKRILSIEKKKIDEKI